MRVKHIMTSPVLTIPSTMPVLEAAKIMKERKIERLPVVDGGKLLGIVTRTGCSAPRPPWRRA